MPVIVDTPEYQVIETVTANGRTVEYRNKPGSSAANAQTITTRARQALGANATYLALATPTAGQTTAQVKALTRQTNALIRLLLQELQDVSDT